MEAHARSPCADPDPPDALADGLRALLAKRLGAMVRRGERDEAVALLRGTLGERRADIVIAAMMPEPEKGPEEKTAEAGKEPRREADRDASDQGDLFPGGG